MLSVYQLFVLENEGALPNKIARPLRTCKWKEEQKEKRIKREELQERNRRCTPRVLRFRP